VSALPDGPDKDAALLVLLRTEALCKAKTDEANEANRSAKVVKASVDSAGGAAKEEAGGVKEEEKAETVQFETEQRALVTGNEGDVVAAQDAEQDLDNAEDNALGAKAIEDAELEQKTIAAKQMKEEQEERESEAHELKLVLIQRQKNRGRLRNRERNARLEHQKLKDKQNELKAKIGVPIQLARLQNLVKLYEEKLAGVDDRWSTVEVPDTTEGKPAV